MLGKVQISIKVRKFIKRVLRIGLITLIVFIMVFFFTGGNYIKVKNDGLQINDAKDGVVDMVTGVNVRGSSSSNYSATDVPATGTVTIGDKTYYKYYQYDEKYKSVPYGDSTVYTAGCGPVSIAMILSGLLGEQVTPESFLKNVEAEYPDSSYYCGSWGSSYPGIFTSSFLEKYYGVKSVDLGQSSSKGLEYLGNGHPVIASIGIGSDRRTYYSLSSTRRWKKWFLCFRLNK